MPLFKISELLIEDLPTLCPTVVACRDGFEQALPVIS